MGFFVWIENSRTYWQPLAKRSTAQMYRAFTPFSALSAFSRLRAGHGARIWERTPSSRAMMREPGGKRCLGAALNRPSAYYK